MNALLQADEAERALLGGVLIRGAEVWRELEAEGLTPEDFRQPGLACAAAACGVVVSRGDEISTISVLDAMTVSGQEMIGGVAGIARLDQHATAHNIKSHAAIVRRAAHRRRVHRWHIDQAEAIASDEDIEQADEWRGYLDRSSADLANLASSTQAEATVSSGTVLNEVHRDLADSAAGIQRGSSTGFHQLDLKYRPRGGHLVVKVGRPKMGKTTLALALTRNALLERQSPEHAWENRADAVPVLWACDEMRNAELMTRTLADVTDLSARMLAQPDRRWLQANTAKIRAASELIHRAPLDFIAEKDCGRLEKIFAAARTWRARQPVNEKTGQRGPAWLFLDYLQRMTMTGVDKHANNEQRVSAMCKAAKTLARELDITVFMLAQLNRDLERREDKRPKSSDIRDSGSVEQEADVILAVYRPIVYEPNAEQLRQRAQLLRHRSNDRAITPAEREELEALVGKLTDAELIVCDNRHGPKGTVYVDFDGSRFRFTPRVRRDS